MYTIEKPLKEVFVPVTVFLFLEFPLDLITVSIYWRSLPVSVYYSLFATEIFNILNIPILKHLSDIFIFCVMSE